MARDERDTVERGLALKKAANTLMEFIGGRAIHPINVRLGGFYSVPTRRELAPLAEGLRRALDEALSTVAWVSGFDFPDLEIEHELLALLQPGCYPIENGEIARTPEHLSEQRNSATTSSSRRCSTPPRSTQLWTGADTSPARWPATR